MFISVKTSSGPALINLDNIMYVQHDRKDPSRSIIYFTKERFLIANQPFDSLITKITLMGGLQ